jgi:S-layer protein (TIGR01567 family)
MSVEEGFELRNLCVILPATFLALLMLAASAHALEIRGSVFNLGMAEVVWTPHNFAGFYYDLDHNLGDESLTFRLSNANPAFATLSDQQDAMGSRGIVYQANMRQVTALSDAKIDTAYGKLRVEDIDSTSGMLTLDNKDNQITLSKNKKIELMPGIWIKTADQSTMTDETPLRYYIYKEITEPGTYELRGSVADSRINEFTWDNSTFPGFYYDIDKNLGTERITFSLSNVNSGSATLSDEPDSSGKRGIVYTTYAQPKNFKFKSWGQYEMIGFLGEGYFAAYDSAVTQSMQDAGQSYPYLYDRSRNRNLITNEQLSKILIDNDTIKLVKKGESLKLKEGYELAIKGVSSEGKVYLQLLKDGQVVDESFIAPSVDNAGMADKTYYYRKDLGETKDMVLIAVHFRSTYKDEEQALAAIDGIWQISETPTPLKSDQQYDKMYLRNVDPTAMTITMDNKDNQVVLKKKIDVGLMPSIHLRTADNETLRYYIYKTETIT